MADRAYFRTAKNKTIESVRPASASRPTSMKYQNKEETYPPLCIVHVGFHTVGVECLVCGRNHKTGHYKAFPVLHLDAHIPIRSLGWLFFLVAHLEWISR